MECRDGVCRPSELLAVVTAELGKLYFPPQSLRASRFTCAHTDAAHIAGLVEAPDTRAAPSSPAKPRLSGPQDVLSLRHATNLLEGHHLPSVAPSRTNHSAIDTLTRFLSPENVSSDQPVIYSPTTIRSLYYRAESMNQLGMLNSKMLSLLIGLFASLSIDSRISTGHKVPLASRLSELSARRTHWAFVLKVGRYKLERGMTLQDSDRFWLMRAELAIVQAKSPSEPLPGDAHSAVLRARSHYHIIRRHSRRPEVHAYYVESLLAIRDPCLLNLVACDLSFLLRTHRIHHPWLQSLLYELVIQHGSSLSAQSQESVLAALWSRVCKTCDEPSDLILGNNLSGTVPDDVIWNATTVARSLAATLFGFANHHHHNESVDLLGYLLSAFSPLYGLPLRWSSLVLFCICNSSGIQHSNGTQSTRGLTMSQVSTCWQVIFGLAAIEKKILQEKSTALTMPPVAEVLETTRTLHELWLPIMNSPLVSRYLRCAIATSFLGIAGVLANASLVHDFQHFYHVENSSEGRQSLMQKFLVARYIAAAMRVQGLIPDVVQTVLESFSPDMKEQHQALALAVETLAPLDASLAYTLYSFARGKGMKSDPRASHSLAMSFARQGALHQAILLLNDAQLSPEKRGVVVSVMARNIRENPQTRHLPSVLIAIGDELTALYRSHIPPGHFRGHLEQLVAFLAQHGRGSQLFPVILSIFRHTPNFFQPRFFVRYCHALVRHRQFVTTSKFLDAIVTEYPKIARSLRIFTDQVMQTKAFRALKRARPLRGPLSLKLSSRLRRWPQAGLSLERSLQELLISGRVLAAKRIFARAAATIPSKRCTTLGNILLYGVSRQPTPRNGRRVRKVIALYEDLVENQGFRPDRVTANILIKVMIHWRSAFDSPRLRELFDQLVRSGYPAANYSPSHPPFGTRQTQFPGSSGISKLPSFASFEKHSRPLFKMFIKAFYSCNDVEAARRVVGILKVEEHKHAVAKKARQEARRRGRVKAAQRNVDPLDVCTSN